MTPLFKKLNLKDQQVIYVLGAPASLEPALASLGGVTIRRSLAGSGKIEFVLAFVSEQAALDELARKIPARAPGDAVVWFAYPKGSSKRYRSTINRDHGWAALGAAGFESVRMVAIDEDWSAVRFRRAEFIKTLRRDARYAMSKSGKARAGR